MEQKDYLMREIEKIGLLLRAMLGSLLNLKDDLTTEIQIPFGEAMERLVDETGFHPEMFLALDPFAAREYLSGFNGFNTPNLELLAEVLFQLGKTGQPDNRKYLDKALLLFEWCNDRDKTFSGPRESRISEIKSIL